VFSLVDSALNKRCQHLLLSADDRAAARLLLRSLVRRDRQTDKHDAGSADNDDDYT